MRFHTGEKTSVCNSCDCAIQFRTNLKWHMQKKQSNVSLKLGSKFDRTNNWGVHGKTHGTQSLWLLWENPWYGKGHGGIHGKTHGAKILNFDHGGQHHGNSWHVPNSKLWRFFHHFCWIHLNKFAHIKERVAKLRSNVQILCQIDQKREILNKKWKWIWICFEYAVCSSEFLGDGVNVTR